MGRPVKVDTTLIGLFDENTENTDFSSNGFKLLWEREKGINEKELKLWICRKPELKVRVIAAVPDAIDYYNNKYLNSSDWLE